MRIAVSGGGTAGHVSPALAVASASARPGKRTALLFIGPVRGMERGIVQKAHIRYVGVPGGKFRRIPSAGFLGALRHPGTTLRNLIDVFSIAAGVLAAVWQLARFKPDAVFNKGGTVGLPVGFAAAILNIPMVIHEPDLTPGLGNRVLSRWARRIAVGFPAEYYRATFPAARTVFTGTPVQPEMLSGDRRRGRIFAGVQDATPLLLVVGGSQGARNVNTALIDALPQLLEHVHVLHVTGERELGRVTDMATATGLPSTDGSHGYRAAPFLDIVTMADAYAAADVVIARAGANTIAELAALAKPVILIPNREAAAHQVQNARVLKEAGAARVCIEDAAQILQAVTELIDDASSRHALAQAIQRFSAPDAADRIAAILREEGEGA